MKKLLALTVSVALAFALSPIVVKADAPPPTITSNSTLTATGSINTASLNGQYSCSSALSGTFSATVTFEATHDGITWTALGSSSAVGTTTVSVASVLGYRPINFRNRVTAYTSGSVVSAITCTANAVTSSPVGPTAFLGFTGTASTAGVVLTFPNSFAFQDTTYVCVLSSLGTTPLTISYDPTQNTTTSIKAYSASGTPNISVHCWR